MALIRIDRCTDLPQSTPIIWFLVSLLLWALVALLVWRVLKRMHFRSQGLTTIRTRFYRKVFQDKLQNWMKFKAISLEERNFDLSNDLVRITYEERHPGDWGGFRPKVVVEYDERNSFLMAIEITYNRREANKNFAYNYRELKDKIQQELDTAQVWDPSGEDHSSQDLAADKRAAIERRLREEDEEQDDAITK